MLSITFSFFYLKNTETPQISYKQVQQALDKHGEEFIRCVPVDDLLFKLKIKGVISNREMTDIRKCPCKNEKAEKLFEILREQRQPNDFLIFCQSLMENTVTTVSDFGIMLLNEAISSSG